MTKWVIKVFASYKKRISGRMLPFCESLEPDMTFMLLEIEKIVTTWGKTEVAKHYNRCDYKVEASFQSH